MSASETSMTNVDACAVWIEIEARQAYLFETDKLQEMLGASRIMASTVPEKFTESDPCMYFQVVSGEIGIWALKEHQCDLLAHAWQQCDTLASNGVRFACGYIETDRRHFEDQGGDLVKEVIGKLKEVVGEQKQRRLVIDASPSCAFFAPCRIHGWEHANHWTPRPKNLDDRRRLVGQRAFDKRSQWRRFRDGFYERTLVEPIQEALKDLGVTLNKPIEFADLAESQEGAEERQDQYVAFICADGDGMGTLLSGIDWNEGEDWAGDGLKPWQRNQRFALQLDGALIAAFTDAMKTEVLRTLDKSIDADKPVVHVPMLPQLMGGDDMWMIVRRDIALRFAAALADGFSARLATSPDTDVVRRAVRVSQKQDAGAAAPTLSIGIAFAKAGYPASSMISAAESLLKSAKQLRKGQIDGRAQPTEGCLDWHWIESSVSESVTDARTAALSYRQPADNGNPERTFSLTTRPWTLSQTTQALAAVKVFNRIARRKREQLEQVLRDGLEVSLLGWEGWWKSLTPGERQAMNETRDALASLITLDSWAYKNDVPFSPWRSNQSQPNFDTPFLDLLALNDPVTNKGAILQPEGLAQ